MGKRDSKAAKAKRAERRGKGALKTEEKTAKGEQKQKRRDANRQDDEDLEKVLKEFAAMQADEAKVGEQAVPPPSPRANGSLTLHPSGNELLLFGGEHFDGKKNTFYNELYRYSIKRNDWRLVTSKRAPPPRSSHQAAAVPTGGGSLFVFGGEFSSANQSQFYHYRDLWCLDLATYVWEQVQAKNGPSARSGHRMVHCRDRLLVFGGFFDNLRDVKYYNDAHVFDLSLYQWHKLVTAPGDPVPQPRSGCSLAADPAAGAVFLYGGYYKKKVAMQQFDSHKDKAAVEELSETGVEFRDTWRLDLFGDSASGVRPGSWTQQKKSGAPPSSRSGCSMVLNRGRLVVFGGVHDEDTADGDGLVSEFYADAHSYTIETGRWRALAVESKPGKPAALAAADSGGGEGGVASRAAEGGDATSLLALGGGRRRNRNRNDSDDEDVAGAAALAAGTAAGAAEPPLAESEEGGAASAPAPCPRMNHRVALKGNTMYVYGGLYEPEESSEITLNDMWSVDLSKLDGWTCLHAGNAPEDALVRELSDDGSSSDDSSEGEGEEEESGSSDSEDETAGPPS